MNLFKSLFTKKKTNKLNNALFSSNVDYPMPKVKTPKDTLISLDYLNCVRDELKEEQRLEKLRTEAYKVECEQCGRVWAEFIKNELMENHIPKSVVESIGIHGSIIEYTCKISRDDGKGGLGSTYNLYKYNMCDLKIGDAKKFVGQILNDIKTIKVQLTEDKKDGN